LRANGFVYRELQDSWIREFRQAPRSTVFAAMPGLRRLTGAFEVAGDVKIRPIDLFVTKGYRQAGVVLVGDGFSSSCPAAGTGVSKVLVDVARLCKEHIPNWLMTPGMAADKIDTYYDDPVRRTNEAACLAQAHYVRAIAVDDSLAWQAGRWIKFLGQLGLGTLLARRAGLPHPVPNRLELSDRSIGR
jgi:2-polyprenyl-6-methoxyphenol hydroxylase-like FAD-dependent oxidoreductase